MKKKILSFLFSFIGFLSVCLFCMHFFARCRREIIEVNTHFKIKRPWRMDGRLGWDAMGWYGSIVAVIVATTVASLHLANDAVVRYGTLVRNVCPLSIGYRCGA